MKDNCIIFIPDAPVAENIEIELKKIFGIERAIHIYTDLLNRSYETSKNVASASMMISYKKSVNHPNLTWLDEDDPGFLEAKLKNFNERVLSSFGWAFDAGAKKAVLFNCFSPEVKPEWIEQSFNLLSDENIIIGPTDEKPYLFGIGAKNIDLLEEINFLKSDMFDDICEKAKKNSLKTETLRETYVIRNEESLRKWTELKDSDSLLFKKKEYQKEHKKRDKKKHHSDKNNIFQ